MTHETGRRPANELGLLYRQPLRSVRTPTADDVLHGAYYRTAPKPDYPADECSRYTNFQESERSGRWVDDEADHQSGHCSDRSTRHGSHERPPNGEWSFSQHTIPGTLIRRLKLAPI